MKEHDTSLLIVYTGGTIGMIKDTYTGALKPIDFEQIAEEVPELKKFGYKLATHTFSPLIDSSDVNPEIWGRLAKIIFDNYNTYDGFLILHGTDTMSYTASALSFMLENLKKPVILTGSQLPIGTLRTDGRENLISAIEIAASREKNMPIITEVCVYFENKLYRGNRTTKHNADYFNAFISPNYPPLAETGVYIHYNYANIYSSEKQAALEIFTNMDNNVAILKLFPGINEQVVEAIFNIKNLKAVVLETFGSGNAPTVKWLAEKIKRAIEKKIIILNVTQCSEGYVEMGKYETSVALKNAGVVSGYDITTEAAVTKLMFLLGQKLKIKDIIDQLNQSIRGEITV